MAALAAWRTGSGRIAGHAQLAGAAVARTARRVACQLLPHAMFGVLAGLLLTFTAIATAAGRGVADPAAIGSAAAIIAPLSLSMGAAEWLLLSYRRRAYLLLHKTSTVSAFAAGARRALGATVAGYLATLAALTAAFDWLFSPAATAASPAPPALLGNGPPPLVTNALTPLPALPHRGGPDLALRPAGMLPPGTRLALRAASMSPHAPGRAPHVAALYPPSPGAWLLLHAAYLALGGAIYVGLVMQSCGRSAAPLCLAALALAAEAAVTWAGSPAWDAAALPAIQLTCYGSLLVAACAVALTAVSKVARHA